MWLNRNPRIHAGRYWILFSTLRVAVSGHARRSPVQKWNCSKDNNNNNINNNKQVAGCCGRVFRLEGKRTPAQTQYWETENVLEPVSVSVQDSFVRLSKATKKRPRRLGKLPMHSYCFGSTALFLLLRAGKKTNLKFFIYFYYFIQHKSISSLHYFII